MKTQAVNSQQLSYEAVIGLETHIQLNTTTKIFCACKADSWDDPPNTNICPVCTGLPGVLPVLNKAVVEKARPAGCRHACRDPAGLLLRPQELLLPRPAQGLPDLAVRSCPLARGGYLDVPMPRWGYVRRVTIRKLHIEEDAGKTKNEGGQRLIDFNRCGVPLVEMVTGPDLRSRRRSRPIPDPPAPAPALAGHLRSGHGERPPALRRQRLHPPGGRRLSQPQDRDQECQLDRRGARRHPEGDRAPDPRGRGRASGSKPGRWNGTRMPECCARCAPRRPRPITATSASRTCCRSCWTTPGMEAQILAGFPELPLERRQRFMEQYGLPEYDADILTGERSLSDYFEKAVQGLRRRSKARLQLADERCAAHDQ